MTDFRKSTFSSGGDNCVEVKEHDNGLREVRHSRNGFNILAFTPSEWDAFVKGVKAGEFD